MSQLDCGTAVVKVFEAAGIDTIFMLHGGHIDPILKAADDAGMRLLDTRHEAVTGYAADGYFRMTGQLAVSLTTAGPGFTNVLSAMASAHLDRIPVLFISGAPPLRDGECNVLQGGIDQVAIAEPMTKWSGRATSAETAIHLTAHAIRVATTGTPGPVFLELPIDVLFTPWEQDDSLFEGLSFDRVRPAPTLDAIEQSMDVLAAAERPAILVGTGAVLSGCGSELLEFAHKADIPIFYSNKGAGLVPGTDSHVCGTFVDVVNSGLNPDTVLLLGARLGMYTGGANGVIPKTAKLIQVDVESSELGRLRKPDIGILADCREVLKALLASDKVLPARPEYIDKAGHSRDWIEQRFGHLKNETGPIHPYQALSVVRGFIDENTMPITDGGDTGGWNEMGLIDKTANPGVFASVGYLGNLGMHGGFAIAAQLVHPDKRVICVPGDGSAGFQIQEFDTFVRHNLPIILIVLNNKYWGMSICAQHMSWEGREIATRLGETRYDLIAEACGGHGELVSEIGELESAIQRALDSGKPACVNVMTTGDTSVMSPRLEAMLSGAADEEVIIPYYANLDAD
jgi:acetolactate synthase-1/2/3 large subunit